jgi:hypothetical protein
VPEQGEEGLRAPRCGAPPRLSGGELSLLPEFLKVPISFTVKERFLGSPTVQIAGQDIEPRAREAERLSLT